MLSATTLGVYLMCFYRDANMHLRASGEYASYGRGCASDNQLAGALASRVQLGYNHGILERAGASSPGGPVREYRLCV
jgi:hypothetical protein